MKIRLTSVFVEDQDKALAFYTGVLGFVPKQSIPAGEYRWLTVASPDEPDGTELSLEPSQNPVAFTFQQGLKEQGIPCTAFAVEDVAQEHQRLQNLGVQFTMPPTGIGPTVIAIFDDTCGNLVQIFQI